MKLQFLRATCSLDIDPARAIVYQFENHNLFTRVVQSLVSELGEEALEPYVLWDEKDKRMSSKKAFLVQNSLPVIYLDDALLKALFQKIDSLFNGVPDLKTNLQDNWKQLQELIVGTNQGYNGTYSFCREFDLTKILKSFGYSPSIDLSNELLDNCMNYFDLCADTQLNKPVILVNAFRFFTENELEVILQKAEFDEISLLLLESGSNRGKIYNEQYITVDQDFIDY